MANVKRGKRGKRRSVLLNKFGGSFTMPGNFKVRVEIMDKDEAQAEMGTQILAQYCHEEHLILLKRSRKLKQRMTDFEHEMQHMVVDWIDHFVRKARYPKR